MGRIRATFFVDSTKNMKVDEYEPIIPFRMEDGVVSRMDKLVEFRDPLGAAAKQFLPRLRAAYLTESVAAAEKLGAKLGRREVEEQGDAYRIRALRGWRTSPKQSYRDAETARRYYRKIPGFDRVDDHMKDLAQVKAKAGSRQWR